MSLHLFSDLFCRVVSFISPWFIFHPFSKNLGSRMIFYFFLNICVYVALNHLSRRTSNISRLVYQHCINVWFPKMAFTLSLMPSNQRWAVRCKSRVKCRRGQTGSDETKRGTRILTNACMCVWERIKATHPKMRSPVGCSWHKWIHNQQMPWVVFYACWLWRWHIGFCLLFFLTTSVLLWMGADRNSL